MMKPAFTGIRFTETWRSGGSDRNTLARLAGARNFLWVTVTRDRLHVSPHFPFSLMFLPEAFGLDHAVPGKTIVDVRETISASRGRSVLIQYRHATGDEERLEVVVSDVPTFLKALAEIRER